MDFLIALLLAGAVIVVLVWLFSDTGKKIIAFFSHKAHKPVYCCRLDEGDNFEVTDSCVLRRSAFSDTDLTISRKPIVLLSQDDGLYAMCGNSNVMYINGERAFKGDKIRLAPGENEIRLQVSEGYRNYVLTVSAQ